MREQIEHNAVEAGREMSRWLGHTVSYLDEDLLLSGVLGEVPSSIRYFKNLERVRAVDCPFLKLPDEFGDLIDLVSLSFTGVQISELPKTIGDLSKLVQLEVNSGALESIPQRVGDLKALRELSLWRNRLRTLPPGVSQLQQLRSLDVSDNDLGVDEPSLRVLANLAALCSLNLSGNRLRTLPDGIDRLHLESLNLSCNYLTNGALSITPGSLPNLRHLSLGLNQLVSLPEFVIHCKRLESLSVSHNLISDLPTDICSRLPSLKRLDIRGNPIGELPSGIEEFLDLKA